MVQKKAIYAEELGIDLKSKKEEELFKWFLACLLFGKPIQQQVAKKTYFEFVKERLTTPDAILAAGWDKLVEVLDRGHYARYDFSTATKLQETCHKLKKDFQTVSSLLKTTKSKKDLQEKLLAFKGIGPVTTNIFLREIKKSNV